MKSVFYVAVFTFKLLCRDRVFMPALLIGSLILFFAGMVSGWTVENYELMLVEIGFAGFHFTGAVVALLWGSKIIGDFKTDGSIELELSSSVSKSRWYFGKCLGLIAVLICIGFMLAAAWQLVMFYFDFGFMKTYQIVGFASFVLEWCLLASVAFFFSSFAGPMTSLFCALILWILGLIIRPIYFAAKSQEPSLLKSVVAEVNMYWDLQRFNLSGIQDVSMDVLVQTFTYGVSLIGIWLIAGALIFARRQLQ